MPNVQVEFATKSPQRSLEPLVARLERKREILEKAVAENAADLDARRELGRVEVALRWAATGFYGTCTVCSDPLPMSQLEANPADTVCRSCREAATRSRRRLQPHVDARPLSLIDGPEALSRGFQRARDLAHE
jgi:RNA polymerase-binding transcription factor DksA